MSAEKKGWRVCIGDFGHDAHWLAPGQPCTNPLHEDSDQVVYGAVECWNCGWHSARPRKAQGICPRCGVEGGECTLQVVDEASYGALPPKPAEYMDDAETREYLEGRGQLRMEL